MPSFIYQHGLQEVFISVFQLIPALIPAFWLDENDLSHHVKLICGPHGNKQLWIVL
jgi:hypothetical protein